MTRRPPGVNPAFLRVDVVEAVRAHQDHHTVLSARTARCATAILAAICLLGPSPARGEWVEQTTPTTEVLLAVDFVDNMNGYAVGSNGAIIKTTDGGATWTDVQDVAYVNDLTDVDFPENDQVGWATGINGTILKTTDGGTTWTPVTVPLVHYQKADFLSNTTGYAVGNESDKQKARQRYPVSDYDY